MRAWFPLALTLVLTAGCASTQQHLDAGRLFDACEGALGEPERERPVAAWLRDAIAPTVWMDVLSPDELTLLFGPEVATRFGDRHALLRVRLTYPQRPAAAVSADPPWRVDSLRLDKHSWSVQSASGRFADLPPEYAEAHDLERGPRAAAAPAAGKARFNLLGGIADALVGGLTLGGVDLELRKRGASTQQLEDLAHIVKTMASAGDTAKPGDPPKGGLIALLERRACEGEAPVTCDSFVLLSRKEAAAAAASAVEVRLSFAVDGPTLDHRCLVSETVRVPLAPGADLDAQLADTFARGPHPLAATTP